MVNTELMKNFLEKLLNTPSPSGYCKDVMSKVSEDFSKLGYEITYNRKGNAVVTIDGINNDYCTAIAAHVDTLGAMVRSVKSNGNLAFTQIGGYSMHTIEGEYCKVHTREGKTYTGTILNTRPSTHVYKDQGSQERVIDNMEIRLDEIVKKADDVKALGIKTGDIISFDSRTVFTESGFVKSRHLDDKAGVAAIYGLLEYLSANSITPKNKLKIVISTYEEVGHGSSALPADIDELLAIDMGAIGSDLNCNEFQVSICAKDSSGPYDYDMVSKLISLSDQNKIDYAIDIYPFYGSDVSAALRAGNDIKGALIGPGVHASHGMERTHMDAIVGTTRLLIHYVG